MPPAAPLAAPPAAAACRATCRCRLPRTPSAPPRARRGPPDDAVQLVATDTDSKVAVCMSTAATSAAFALRVHVGHQPDAAGESTHATKPRRPRRGDAMHACHVGNASTTAVATASSTQLRADEPGLALQATGKGAMRACAAVGVAGLPANLTARHASGSSGRRLRALPASMVGGCTA